MVTAQALTFGFILPHWTGAMGGETARGSDMIALARLAEQHGFDAIWLVDHFRFTPARDLLALGFQSIPDEYHDVEVGAWECWTLIGALAAVTERAELGTLVSNTGYRNPALLAQMAETVDELSGGRLLLGLGAGDCTSEHESHGYPWEGRVGRFEEALQIIRPMLRGETVTFAGEHHQTQKALVGVKGPRPGGPPVTIGMLAGKPRMERLVARYADSWNCFLVFRDSRPEAYRVRRKAMETACARHGRDPATLGRHVTVAVALPGHDVRFQGGIPCPSAVPLRGSQAEVAEQLAVYADEGVDHVSIYAFPMTAEGIEWLAPVLNTVRRS